MLGRVKLMDWIKNGKERIKGLSRAVARYPLTVALLMISAGLTMATIQSEGFFDYYLEVLACIIGATAAAAGQAVSERFFRRKNKGLTWIIGAAVVVLTVLYYLLLRRTLFENEMISYIRTAVLLFALMIAYIWLPSIKTKTTFGESFTAAFKAFFTTVLFSAILALGSMMILGTVNLLLFQVDYRLYAYVMNGIIQLFAPLYFLSMIPLYPAVSDERYPEEQSDPEQQKLEQAVSAPRTLTILISYIIVPLLAIFTLILLLYILSNITGEFWTDNLLEPMLITYSIIGIITLFLTGRMENKSIELFNTYFPKLLLVVVTFQTMASILKIGQLGITHGRYYVILFGVFAVISSFFYSFLPKQKDSVVPALLISFTVISIIPPVDAFTVGREGQIRQLESVLAENGMLENQTVTPNPDIPMEEKEKIVYSVQYLDRMNELDELDWIPGSFSIYNDFASVFGFDRYSYEAEDQEVIEEAGSFLVRLQDSQSYAFDVETADQFVMLSANEMTSGTSASSGIDLTIDSNGYVLRWEGQEENLVLQLTDSDNEEVLAFDLQFLLEDTFAFSDEDQLLTTEEASFSEENEEAALTVIINSLSVYEDGIGFDADFYVLVTIK